MPELLAVPRRGDEVLAFAYQPAAWHDFYVTYAQINAALWGFFFVAISLHPGQIGRHPGLRNQARLNPLGLSFLLIIGLECIIPHQDAHALGIELTALWLVLIGVCGTALAPTLRGSGHTRAPRVVQVRGIGALVMSVLGLCAGVTSWYGAGGGLLWERRSDCAGQRLGALDCLGHHVRAGVVRVRITSPRAASCRGCK
jgi:hypothetical protein